MGVPIQKIAKKYHQMAYAGMAISRLRQEGPAGLIPLQTHLDFQAEEAPLVAALKELQASND